MLFDVSIFENRPSTAPIFSLLKTYNLVKGSIWINSRFLAANAPVGSYTGLAVNGGNVTLTTIPADLNGKLTVSANTTITVSLELNQPEVISSGEDTPFGIDARNLELELPATLNFHFSGQGRTIDDIGNASWNLYGQSLNFEWDSQSQTSYNPLLQRIIFPFKASAQTLEIRQTESEFNNISNSAPISRSAWALPVALIDISQPTEASGSGEMLVQCRKGLVNLWRGLEGGGFNLVNPTFVVSPGQIFLAELTAGNPHAHQSLDLWKDDVNEFGTRINLTFPSTSLFFYVSNADGNELFTVFANADFQIDRPVKVNGEPLAIRSLNSLLIVGANATNKLIYLFDDNLIQDDALRKNKEPIPEKFAIALTNALFKVSQVNGRVSARKKEP